MVVLDLLLDITTPIQQVEEETLVRRHQLLHMVECYSILVSVCKSILLLEVFILFIMDGRTMLVGQSTSTLVVVLERRQIQVLDIDLTISLREPEQPVIRFSGR